MRRICPLVFLIAVAPGAVFAQDDADDFEDSGLSADIAGTYISVDDDGAVMMQIGADGNLTLTYSLQFEGGALGDTFSNTLGSWIETGDLTIAASTVDIVFDDGGVFVGVAAADYEIQFAPDLESANALCEGAIYPPGADPYDAGAAPIEESEFDCGDVPMAFKRIPEAGE